MLFLLVPHNHPLLDVISWITGVQQGGGVGGFILTLIQEGQVDLGCNVGLTLRSRSRAGDFRDDMFIVEMDSVTVVKLGNMVSPPWKKSIRERPEESIGGLFASLNGSVAIEELLPNEGWVSVLPKVALLVPSRSCRHG
jgi:hypothetical protein